jgi:hypothetical protein
VSGAQAGTVFADVAGDAGTIPAEGADRDAIESARERLLATFDPRGGVLAVLDLTRGSVPSDIPVNLAVALADTHEGVDLLLPDWAPEDVDTLIKIMGGPARQVASGRIPVLKGRLTLVASPRNNKSGPPSGMRLMQSAKDEREPGRALVIAVPPDAAGALRLAAGRMSDSTVLVVEKLGTRIGQLARLATELRAVDTVVRGTILVARDRQPATEPEEPEEKPAPAAAAAKAQR